MKITTPETIESSEKEFIDTINAELDWEAIEKLLIEKHNFHLQDEVDYKNGDLLVHNNQIAYRLDFEIKIALSMTVGRDGRCLEITTSGDNDSDDNDEWFDEETGTREDHVESEGVPEQKDMSGMTSQLADMISDINEESGINEGGDG